MASSDDYAVTGAMETIKKQIGKDFKYPKQWQAEVAKINKANAEARKVSDSFIAKRAELAQVLLDLQNAEAKIKNTMKQAGNNLSDCDFGLDTKNPDGKKKTDQAQKLLDKAFAEDEDDMEDRQKMLDELDKHMMHMRKYKGPGN